ncbi:hypothetical protein [Sulfuriflexus mobilis]|uniref:hypothetical protein n=1 Tax=Sulfuriflexus mobilis TaxID=1811807 RepID=UPI0018D52726|nr:hypothetical protein [Sulfuriflexus mobilis]
MAIESPLFQSAMELLGHSFSHFNGSKELDRKLVILHLANSIELILKDLVLDAGESIYKGPKETITIHGCIKSLEDKDIKIPFLNKIELLIDERNALQHRFGSPNELTAIFYMNISQEFFREILKEHYDLEYEEVITQFAEEKELLAFRMREPSDDAELENLKKLSKVHPLGALLSAMTYLEKNILDFSEKAGLGEDFRRRPYWHMISHRFLERFDVITPDELREKMDDTRRLRNMAAHGRKEPTRDEVARAISSIEEFEKFLSTIDMSAVEKKVKAYLEEREEERNQRTLELEKEIG